MPELAIDHVVIGVADLDAAAARLLERHGLASAGGGRHDAWGTANRIVPLGGSYLELVTVADPSVARDNVFGRWVTSMLEGGPGLAWAVRTDDVAVTAQRVGLVVEDGSRVDASGRTLRWRLAGVGQAAETPGRPFLIGWGDRTPHPGDAAVSHPAAPVRLARVVVGGDAAWLGAWLGGDLDGVVVRDGAPGLQEAVVATARGEVVLDADGQWQA